MGDLTIVVSVRNDRTMSQYALPRNRKLTFVNDSDELLVVTSKSGTPFVDMDDPTKPIDRIEVPANGEKTVRINRHFSGTEFGYTAQIGDADADDPIVILERPR